MPEPKVTNYCITGILINGKRFATIYTTTPQHYNIWRGNIWEVDKESRKKLIKTINN